MIRHTFSDGSYIEYRQGRFDKWCIFELIDNDKTPEDAANSSKGKTWKDLDKLCKLNHL